MINPTILTLIATFYLFVSLLFLAPRKPGYSHIRHTISELGEIGAPQQRFIAFGLFLPVGLLLLGVTYLTYTIFGPAAILAFSLALGYIVAAAFPCDVGSPFVGTTRQTIHNLGGAVEYIGGAFALQRIAQDLGEPFAIAGFIVLGAAVALSLAPLAPVRGLIQRVAELCLFGGLALSLLAQA